jgi:hypothetical protein
LVFVGIPLVIYAMRRPDWADSAARSQFEPFGWERDKRD